MWSVSVTPSAILFPCRYNNYDRSPIDTVPPEVVRRWYAAHRLLTAQLRDPENELWVKLMPGRVRNPALKFIRAFVSS